MPVENSLGSETVINVTFSEREKEEGGKEGRERVGEKTRVMKWSQIEYNMHEGTTTESSIVPCDWLTKQLGEACIQNQLACCAWRFN